MLIRTKRQYYELAAKGLMGNCMPTWLDAETFLRETNDTHAGVRIMTPGSQAFRGNVPRDKLRDTIAALGLRPGDYCISRTFDNQKHVRMQGELSVVEGLWVLWYSTERGFMRDALAKKSHHIFGPYVWYLLSIYALPGDIDDLHLLFAEYSPQDQYPVIEFTITDIPLGIWPSRKAIIWEVRHY